MTKRTGNRPGQGRQPTIAPGGATERLSVRVTAEQRAEFDRRGAQALREWLNDRDNGEPKKT